MQLDRTQIVIRERQFWEIVDLALPLFRRNFGRLVQAMAIGVLPCMLVNHWLIGWMVATENLEYETAEFPWRYVFDMAMLVFLEAPLASACGTLFLGKAAFLERPSFREMLVELRRSAWRLLVCQGCVRGVLIAWVALALPADSSWPNGGEVVLTIAVVVAMAIRSFRPYMNEIILLEQNPLIAKTPQQQSIARRSERLHQGGDHFARWLGTCWISILLTFALALTMLFIAGFLLGNWRWTFLHNNFAIPLSMWLVATYVTVVRYLNYLDTRIRQEGWEVELRMRAEAQRLAARIVASIVVVALTIATVIAASDGGLIAAEAIEPRGSVARIDARILHATMPLTVLAVADTSAEETAKEALVRQRFPWYDSQSDSLRRVTVRDQQARDENRKSRWDIDGKPEDASKTPKSNALNATSWRDVLRGIITVLIYALIGMLVMVLVAVLIRYFLRREQSSADSPKTGADEEGASGSLRLEDLPFPVQAPLTDLLTAARMAYQQGDFGQAMVYYFSYQLVELDRGQWIHLARGKTNRQYLREVRGQPELAGMLGRTMVLFESVFFGDHRLEREEFESCWNELPAFQKCLERTVA